MLHSITLRATRCVAATNNQPIACARQRGTTRVAITPAASTHTPSHFHGSMPIAYSPMLITKFHAAGHASRDAPARATGSSISASEIAVAIAAIAATRSSHVVSCKVLRMFWSLTDARVVD